MTRDFNRRTFLAAAAGLSVSLTGIRAAQAQQGRVVVANWGGDWNDRTVRHLEAPYVTKAGYEVVHDLAATPQRRTKLIAGRLLPRSPLDVAHTDDSVAYELAAMGALAELDEKAIPRLADVVPSLRLPTFVPWQYSAWVIGYNPGTVKEAPGSFSDLWDPKFKGLIGLSDTHWAHHVEMAALKTGGSLDRVDVAAVKSALLEMKKAVEPRIYPGHLQIAQALKNGEIQITTNYKARVLQFGVDGVSVKPQYPAEGGITMVFGMVITKNAANMEGARFYCNALLTPEGQSSLVQESLYTPANTRAQLPPDVAATIAFSNEEQGKLVNRSHVFWQEHRSELLDWWNKEFKS
ncbi:MAG: extracellular solute-binding protein [Burkholderiaceae bacterium]|nr:extracellular solute-binding protein [Burkholderiaceae bacterium]